MRTFQKYLLNFFFLFVLFSLTLSAGENYLSISVEATLMASDPDEMARTLRGWAEENGGYFTYMSTDYVILRFPWRNTSAFQSFLDQVSDDLFSYSSQATDLRESILSAKSGIEAREEILQRNLQLINAADFKGTLFLETEILRLMNEIEQLKGSLRKEENDRQMAQAVIHINFQSQTLPDFIPSSFEWINSLSFADFTGGPFSGKARGSRYDLEGPSGFALVDNRSFFRAISPEGVRFQIRKGKNYPLKELEFWSATFVRHMEESGYQKKDDGKIFETATGVRGYAVEWGLSMGNSDYLYLTAIVPYKKNIFIIEAAGEHNIFRNYREAVYSAMESFSP